MVCIDCSLHGRRVHTLSEEGKDEYVFITQRSQVFPENCMSCRDPECQYNFNDTLLKHKRLRKKVIDYVFDATLDDKLAKHGFVMLRTTPVIRETVSDMYSKPCYDKKQGKLLRKLDNKVLKTRTIYFKTVDNYSKKLKGMKSNYPRIIIKRKKKL